MSEVTHEQVNLMLRLFEMRREPRLREAREWYMANFHPTSMEELMQKYPPSSKENASMRMVISYWEMCAGIVNRGLINDELYFESNGEVWAVWERLKPTVAGFRAAFGSPTAFQHMEKLCTRIEAHREKTAPGSVAKMRQMMQQMAQTHGKSAAN